MSKCLETSWTNFKILEHSNHVKQIAQSIFWTLPYFAFSLAQKIFMWTTTVFFCYCVLLKRIFHVKYALYTVDHIETCVAKAEWWYFCQQLYVIIILKFNLSQEHNGFLGWLAFQRLLKWFWYLIWIPLFIFGLRVTFSRLTYLVIQYMVELPQHLYVFPCNRVSVMGCHSAKNWVNWAE